VENCKTERRKGDRWAVARRKEMSELGEVILKTWQKGVLHSVRKRFLLPSYKCTGNGMRRSNDEALVDVGRRSTFNRLGSEPTYGTALEVVG
jgi:hypothetical protein